MTAGHALEARSCASSAASGGATTNGSRGSAARPFVVVLPVAPAWRSPFLSFELEALRMGAARRLTTLAWTPSRASRRWLPRGPGLSVPLDGRHPPTSSARDAACHPCQCRRPPSMRASRNCVCMSAFRPVAISRPPSSGVGPVYTAHVHALHAQRCRRHFFPSNSSHAGRALIHRPSIVQVFFSSPRRCGLRQPAPPQQSIFSIHGPAAWRLIPSDMWMVVCPASRVRGSTLHVVRRCRHRTNRTNTSNTQPLMDRRCIRMLPADTITGSFCTNTPSVAIRYKRGAASAKQ